MGIKDYHKWMKQSYPNAFKTQWLDFYDHLYIDINYLVHYVHYGSKTQNQILYKFFSCIERLVKTYNPTKSIIIANDGPAPIAKLLLQRERRIIASREIKGDTKELNTSSLIYSPGTEFMDTIKEKIETFMEKIKLFYCIDVDYMIGCEGEAELKLKEKMAENIKKNKNDTHIIISSDADVIAMFGTFEYTDYYKIFICCNIKTMEVISVGELMNYHTDKYGFSNKFGLDFTLISILLGNDYLPKISFCDLDKMWNSYKLFVDEYKDGLVDDKLNININFFTEILNGIISKTKYHYINKFSLDSFNLPLYSNYMEGMLWCLNMYNNGKCSRYNYMYQCDDSPHPYGLIMHLKLYPEIAKFNDEIYKSLNKNLYAILVLPQKAIELINKKYHDFANNYDILYEEELCEDCVKLHIEKSKYTREEEEYKKKSIELKNHRIKHRNITMDDIEEISNKFTETFG
jgi:hypothetical protein